MLLVLSLGGHMNSYRLTVYGHGAFELCLPSLGFFLTKLSLRSQILGQPNHMAKVRVGWERHLQQDAVRTLVGECADAVMHDEAGHDYGSGYQYDSECCLHICVFTSRGR